MTASSARSRPYPSRPRRSSSDGEHWFPSRDLFQFEGTLYPDQITGTLIHADALTPDRAGQAEEVKLYRAKDEETAMPRPGAGVKA